MIHHEAFATLDRSWRISLAPPDRRPIPDWLHEHWVLPASYAQPGRFDIATSRYLIDPFTAFQDDAVREITCMAPIQTGKTLLAEGCITWALCNAPGPIMWTFQTDADASEHCNQRFMAALKAVPQVRAMLPMNRHHEQTQAIYFGNFFLEVNGANLTSLQRVSIRYKFNSECWLWKAGLMAHARGRVTKFEEAGNSKVFNESQGGSHNDDFSMAWNAGTQQVWCIQCAGCKRHTPLVFAAPYAGDSKKFAGCVWEPDAKRRDGSWDVARACETVRWVCPECGFAHSDSAQTRARWNENGAYSAAVSGSRPENVSFRWEALVSRPMASLVQQFLTARIAQKSGVDQLMQDFQRQRRGLPWKAEEGDSVTIAMKASGYVLTSDDITKPIPNESKRFLTVDRQKDHFWGVVRAWRRDGASRLLWRGRFATEAQIEEVQKQFGIEPQLVFEDAGYFPSAVYSDCSQFGWTALKGSGENYFKIASRNPRAHEQQLRRIWSDVTRVLQDGKQIPLIHWASDPVKDVLLNLRLGRGASWECADDAGEEYFRQLQGDHKVQRTNAKTNRPEWRWVRRHANHYHDCEAMQVCAAMMLGILLPPTPNDENNS